MNLDYEVHLMINVSGLTLFFVLVVEQLFIYIISY